MNYLQKELYELVRGGDKILNFFQNVSLDGVWYWDLENPENEWMSESFWATLGYDPEKMPHKMSAWKDIVNKEDLARVEKAIHEHLANPDTRFDEIIRYKHNAGHTVWIRCAGMAIRDDGGKPVRMLGTHIDISEQVRKEKFLEKCNAGANIGYWEVEVESRKLYWSETTKKIHEVGNDYQPDISTAINFYAEDNSRDKVAEAVKKAFKDGTPYDLELKLVTAKGREIWVRSIGNAELFNGTCVRLYGSIQDIDNQKKAELELQESRNRFEMLVENIPGATYQYTITTSGKEKIFSLDYISSHILEITGYSPDRFLNDDEISIKQLLHKDDFERVISKVHNANDKNNSWQIEYRLSHKDGSTRWIREKGNVFTKTENGSTKLIGAIFDVTNEVEANRKRAEERNLLRTIIDNVPVNIYMKDKHRRKILANPAEVKYSGYEKEEEVLGKTDEELYDLEIVNNYLLEDLKVLNEGVSLRELENDMGNGRWALVSKIPLKNEEGEVEAIVGITVDITERKESEIKLKKSEEQFRKTFEYSANGMAIISMEGKYIQVNKAYEEILGYSNEELKNKNFRDISHPDDLKGNEPLIKELAEGKRDYYIMDKRYIHKDGSYVWAHLAASLIKDEIGGKPYFISQITDITREKAAQQELSETLDKLKSILDASTRVAIVGTDVNGLITSFNKGAENLLGYTAQEIVGKKTPVKFHLNEELQQRKNELFNDESIDVNGFDILKHFASKQKFTTKEWVFVRKNGSKFPVQLTITEIKGVDGQLNGYLGIASDITELKRRENELEHLLDINKDQNERLLNFAHIVSHNLKGHAGNYSMIMELLKDEESPEEIKQFIDMLLTATKNLNDTVENLNDIVEANTKTSETKKQVNIKETLQMAVGNLNAIVNEAGAKLNFNVEDDETVNAVPAYLDSIFHNFISNAIKYRSPERKPVIHISTGETENYKVISFEDNGLGIDLEKTGGKLFEMFKTFHGNSDARGVGLFITKNQIESMGGRVEVESEVNKGSIFKVYLPK